MKKKIEQLLQEKKIDLELDRALELGNAASMTDCTGTVARAPQTKAEWDSYDRTYHFKPEVYEKK